MFFIGTVLETEASSTDHYENASGPGATSRKDLYRQVSQGKRPLPAQVIVKHTVGQVLYAHNKYLQDL